MANYHYKQIKDLTHINEQASAFILVFKFKAEEDFSNARFAAVNSDKDPFPGARFQGQCQILPWLHLCICKSSLYPSGNFCWFLCNTGWYTGLWLEIIQICAKSPI